VHITPRLLKEKESFQDVHIVGEEIYMLVKDYPKQQP
jgi:hypothetical protein